MVMLPPEKAILPPAAPLALAEMAPLAGWLEAPLSMNNAPPGELIAMVPPLLPRSELADICAAAPMCMPPAPELVIDMVPPLPVDPMASALILPLTPLVEAPLSIKKMLELLKERLMLPPLPAVLPLSALMPPDTDRLPALLRLAVPPLPLPLPATDMAPVTLMLLAPAGVAALVPEAKLKVAPFPLAPGVADREVIRIVSAPPASRVTLPPSPPAGPASASILRKGLLEPVPTSMLLDGPVMLTEIWPPAPVADPDWLALACRFNVPLPDSDVPVSTIVPPGKLPLPP